MKQYPEAKGVEGMLLVRIDAPMYFANVQVHPHHKNECMTNLVLRARAQHMLVNREECAPCNCLVAVS